MNSKWPAPAAAALLLLLCNSAVAELAIIDPNEISPPPLVEFHHDFKCKPGNVMVGRVRLEDKVGYVCGSVTQSGEVLNTYNEIKIIATGALANCQSPKIMTGRGRDILDASNYWIHCAEVRDIWGLPLTPSHTSTQKFKDSNHGMQCAANEVFSGMKLYSDTSLETEYYCSKLF